MSDVIEVMARAANDGTESLELTRRDVIDALRAAEREGWRLVPVEPDTKMEVAGFESDEWDSLGSQVLERGGWPYSCKQSAECVAGIFKAMAEAAPRPWEEKE